MAMKHTDKLWMNAEPELVEKVARLLCERHGFEIFGHEAITPAFLDDRWRMFECEARDAIAAVRSWGAPA